MHALKQNWHPLINTSKERIVATIHCYWPHISLDLAIILAGGITLRDWAVPVCSTIRDMRQPGSGVCTRQMISFIWDQTKFWVDCFNCLLVIVCAPFWPSPNSPPFTSTASLKSHSSVCPLLVQVGQLQPVLLTFWFLEFLLQFQIRSSTTDQESAT